MKLFTEPGVSLLILAAVTYAVKFPVAKIPAVGGALAFMAWPVMIFCVVGGFYLLFTSLRDRDKA